MRINEVDRELTQTELDQLETFADKLFAKVGIDVEFTRHFLDRVNDERNVRQITAGELTRLFKQEYKRWGKQIAQLGPDTEAVLKDLATDVNIPFALRWDSSNNELDLIAKTVMRKPDFKTSNQEFAVEYTTSTKDLNIIMEGLPALNNGGALGTGLTPNEFKTRYGMTPANANKTLGNVIELFPQEIKNNPRFRPFIKQYIMNPKQLGNLKAVNDNIIDLDKWKKKNANNKSWKRFFKTAPLRALGSFVTFMLTPSQLGDGTIPMDERLVMDTISNMTKADPLAMMEIIKSSYPDTYQDMWYYKNAVQTYSDQIISQLDGKVDPALQKAVEKVKKAKEMEKWNDMPLDPGLQKALDASQPKVDFTTGPEMGEPAPKIEPSPEVPEPANDPEPPKEPEVIPFPKPRPEKQPEVPEPDKKPEVEPEGPEQPKEPEVKPDEKPKVIPFPPAPETPEVPELPEPKVEPEPAPEKPELPEPKVEPAPEQPKQPKVEPDKKPAPAPSTEPDFDPIRDPNKDPLPVPNFEPTPDPQELPEPIKIEPAPKIPQPQQEPVPQPKTEPAPITKPEIQPTPGNVQAPKLDVLPVPAPKPNLGKVPPRIPQNKYRRKDWDIGGYNDLYKTNLYRWTQKYGTFENSEMGKKLFGEDYAKMTHALITKMVKQGKTDDEIQKATGEHGKRIELIRKNTEKETVKENSISTRISNTTNKTGNGTNQTFSKYIQKTGNDGGMSLSKVSNLNKTASGTTGTTTKRFVRPGGSGTNTTFNHGTGKVTRTNFQLKGPQSWAYDKKLNSSVTKEAQAVAGGKVHKNITGYNLTWKGAKQEKIDFELISIDNATKSVKLGILRPEEFAGEVANVSFKTLRRGPFVKTELNESIIMEGGAMPGVGAIHIDEINPTLEQLEKTLDLDLKNFTLGSVGKRQFSGDIDVALNLKPEELPAFIEKLKKNPLIKDIAKSSVIMTKVQIQNFDKSKSDGRPRTGFVQLDFMPGDPGWLKTYFHSPSEKESKYKGVFRNVMVATMAAVHNRDDSDAQVEDGRPLESRRFMWSPTDGLVRVLRTPVPAKNGDGYTKKNQNKIIDGPFKQADEIAKQLGLNSAKDLNSFESLLDAMKKNYTQEEQKKVIDGLKDSKVVQDIGIPDEIKDL